MPGAKSTPGPEDRVDETHEEEFDFDHNFTPQQIDECTRLELAAEDHRWKLTKTHLRASWDSQQF